MVINIIIRLVTRKKSQMYTAVLGLRSKVLMCVIINIYIAKVDSLGSTNVKNCKYLSFLKNILKAWIILKGKKNVILESAQVADFWLRNSDIAEHTVSRLRIRQYVTTYLLLTYLMEQSSKNATTNVTAETL